MSTSVQDPTLLAELTSHLLVPVVVIDDARTADSLVTRSSRVACR